MEAIQPDYDKWASEVRLARQRLKRPLTLVEKILFSHLAVWPEQGIIRGQTQLFLRPDRVAMQDATAQMALLQFMVTQRLSVAVPSSIHCDHLIQARSGSKEDLERALAENREVYDFLASASAKYGIEFWQPGSGIIHQVVLEQYAFPGGLMIGTDSHTPNAGGLGMLAVGVGGADAVDVMADQPWGLVAPKLVGVRLTGRLKGWASPKDVILKVAGTLTVKGGTGKILEYFGPGTQSISCTGKATITNMGAELGATTSIFPYDSRMSEYLRATERDIIANLADRHIDYLSADPEIEASPQQYFDEVIEIDLSALEPQWVGPHTPDLLRNVSSMREAVKQNDYPDGIRVALIGSCTNSSYEDMTRAAHVARQAAERGLRTKVPLLVTPGSDQIYRTIERDGLLKVFTDVGATVLANACGPCIGQWKRTDLAANEPNTIVTSYNRNFARRNDGNPSTLAFISSPEVVTAVAFAGSLSFDPQHDDLIDGTGQRFRFREPEGSELPGEGFVFSRQGRVVPSASEASRRSLSVTIDPTSDRLALLEPFPPWNGHDFDDLVVLLKAKGKCTTDHISQAGPWLKYRGHLAKISDNAFLGALNAFSAEVGKGTNVLTGEEHVPFPELGKYYKSKQQPWCVVGDENYGEGSSREHAAMSPRYLGCVVVVARSFARIHETNLKKQGILPLTFVQPQAWDAIKQDSRLSVKGVTEIRPGASLRLVVSSKDGSAEFELAHTLTAQQIEWFKAGSALNTLKPK